LTDRDITVRSSALGQDPTKIEVREMMTQHPIVVRESDDLSVVTRVMREHQIRRLPVIDTEGQLIGIVGIGDLSNRAGDLDKTAEVVKNVARPENGIHRSVGVRSRSGPASTEPEPVISSR
jgi:CBS-domain-containing membrane protein